MVQQTQRRVTYGPGGFDAGQPDDNVIEEVEETVDLPDEPVQHAVALRAPNGTVYDVTISNVGAFVITLRS